ncbi:F-box protein At5g07610-like [Camellia sinensis]|uniref:F-box protein At5g07610-like n=1 Tax=Camellia sinensis TaxID=4442 RepID=UPI001035977B|nr:F-box protein At5g07610-like [Camellia sinensis]
MAKKVSGERTKTIIGSSSFMISGLSLHGHPNRNLPTLSFLDSVGGDYPFRIKNSCNGLLLCEKDGFVVGNHYTKSYIVCNPTTQKFTLLPQLDRRSYQPSGLYLAFDPSKSPHYKVVLHNCLHYCYRLGNHLDIYSSESASWKQIDVSEPLGVEGVFWNGAIHWLSDGVDFTVGLRLMQRS